MATREQWQKILDRLDKLSRPLPFKVDIVNDVRLHHQSFPGVSTTTEMLFRELADDAGALIGGGFNEWILQLWLNGLGENGRGIVATANTGDVTVQIAWKTDDLVAASEVLVRRLMRESPSLADMYGGSQLATDDRIERPAHKQPNPSQPAKKRTTKEILEDGFAIIAGARDNPPTVDELAKRLKLSRTTLYTKNYKPLVAGLKAITDPAKSQRSLPRGSKSKDGDLDAWN